MIPKETQKELMVVVENDTVSVAISPPVLDGVIVVGQAPEQNADTLLFSSYDPVNGIMFARTADGREVAIGNVLIAANAIPPQVIYGSGDPSPASGGINKIYIDTTDGSIWSWT
jgi:hypothetical protein